MNFRPVLREVLMALHICGLNPYEQDLFARCRNAMAFLCLTITIVEVSFEAMFSSTFSKALEIIIVTLGWQLMLFKVWTLTSHRNELKCLIGNIQDKFWESNKYGAPLQMEIKGILKNLMRIFTVLVILYFGAVLAYNFNPKFIKTQTFAFQYYHVPKNLNLAQYILVFFFQIFVVVLVGIPSFIGFDCLFSTIIVYNICELKLIKMGLSELARDGSENDGLVEIKSLLEHHNLILDSIKQVNGVFSSFLTNLFVSQTFAVCAALINLLNNGFPPHISDVFLITLYLSLLFVCCMLGTLLSEESESVADAAYSCGWWKSRQINLRRQLALTIQRSQKPTKLIAFKMLELDLITFTRIMSTAFNFFTVARVVMKKMDV